MRHAAWVVVFAMVGVASAGETLTQEKLKADYMLRLSEFTRGYAGKQMFAKWICLGKPGKFRTRLMQDSLTISVDPDIAACASYDPRKGVLTIRYPPRAFSFSTLTSGTSSLLLWHEAVHALSHGHQTGQLKPSRPFKAAPRITAKTSGSWTSSGQQKHVAWVEEAVDHYYLEWAESCMAGFQALVMLEKQLEANGKEKPPADVAARTQRYWKHFVKATNASGFGEVPNDAERRELEVMTGFRCDPAEVLSGYLSLGYPAEYFGAFVTDAQVWGLFPNREQLGTVGMKESKRVTTLGQLSRTYILSYEEVPVGRRLAVHLTLYGSPYISKRVWDAAVKRSAQLTRRPLRDVGEDAYILDRGPKNADFLMARFWTGHVMISDLTVSGSLEAGNLAATPRPPRPQIASKLFANMATLGSPPIPQGVITAPPKK